MVCNGHWYNRYCFAIQPTLQVEHSIQAQRYNIFCINARKWRLFAIFSLEVRGDEAVIYLSISHKRTCNVHVGCRGITHLGYRRGFARRQTEETGASIGAGHQRRPYNGSTPRRFE